MNKIVDITTIQNKVKILKKRKRKRLQKKKNQVMQLDGKSQLSNEITEDHAVNNNNPVITMPDSRPSNSKTERNELLLDENKASELFNMIYTGILIPELPSRSWSIHYVEVPTRCIVISEMIIRNEIEMGLTPVHAKQIVFDEEMNYKLFLLNAKAFATDISYTVQTLADLTCFIMFVNTIKLCSGGPETNLYANVKLECAYRDPQGKWRHNLCTLEVTDNDTCESCLSLIEILQQNRDYINKRKRDSRHKNSVDIAKTTH